VVLLDTVVPEYEVWERHSVALPVSPPRALEVVLSTPAAPDRIARAWLRLRGLGVPHALTPRARRLFRAYWLVVGPFSALIRRRWLKAIAHAAE
jgi:hypothetical protein